MEKQSAELEKVSMTQSRSSVDVGRCLRIAQAKYDIKSAELAKRMGTFPQQIVRYRARKDMSIQTLVSIVAIFGISVDEFLSLEE